MIDVARSRHADLAFINVAAHEVDLDEGVDIVILSELVNDVWDVQKLLERTARLYHSETRMIINQLNMAWQLPVGLARSLGLAQRMLKQNWLSLSDTRNLMRIAGFEVVTTWGEVLWPIRRPSSTHSSTGS